MPDVYTMNFYKNMFAVLHKIIAGFLLLLLWSNDMAAQSRTLEYYLKAAVSGSPLLKDYQNQISANLIDSQRLRATYRPQITATSNNSITPIINGYGYDVTLSNQQAFNEFINLNQTFVGRKNLSAQYKSITLMNDSVRNGQQLTEQELKRAVTAQYIVAYGDLQQLNFNQEINKILRNQEVILNKLTQNNIYRQTDYLTFLVTLKQQELQIKQLQLQYRNDYASLNYLCGIVDTISSVALDAPGLTVQGRAEAATSIFSRRYELDSMRFANDRALLKYNYRPKLSAFLNAGYSSTLLYEAYKNFGVGGGFNLSIPIFDGHQRTLQSRKIGLQENTNQVYKDFFTRQYAQQTAMLWQQLSAAESLIDDINEQIKFSEGLINVNKKLLETGDAKIVDFVLAINNFLTAKNLLTQNNINRMQIINQLNYWNR